MGGVLQPRVVVIAVLLFGLPSLQLAAVVDLARTGQTQCLDQAGSVIACDGTGQDGDVQAGIAWPDPRFTDNGDGTITDNLTGLIWLADPECIGRKEWFDALSATNALADGTCGLSDGSAAGDWRMPNFLELMSPAHMGVSDFLSWLESYGFQDMQAFAYWSSTTIPIPTSSAFTYQFAHRFGGVAPKSFEYQTWPVRGVATGPAKLWRTGLTACYDQVGNSLPCAGTGQDGETQAGVAWPNPRFTDNGDGTVTDHLTDLIWLKQADCFADRVWSDAVADANTLQSGSCGLTDGSAAGAWRLPNTWEIVSLIDYSSGGTPLPLGHPFTGAFSSLYWTSTNFLILTDRAYAILSRGNYSFLTKVSEYSAWPVRGGILPNTLLFEDGFESGDTTAWSSSSP
jgi:hypothetical protein